MTGTNRRSTIALAATLAALPALAFAQGTTPATTTAPRATTTPSMTTQPQAAMSAQARRASEIIGADIYNEANNEIGEVHDLMVHPGGGTVTAVLSVGGFLGLGERYVAVPLNSLQWNASRERWTLPGATEDSLKARPAFTYPERG